MDLDHRIVRALTFIVLASVNGIVVLSLAALVVNATGKATDINIGDQVASVLGQIASAGVGAIAGFWTARAVQHHTEETE